MRHLKFRHDTRIWGSLMQNSERLLDIAISCAPRRALGRFDGLIRQLVCVLLIVVAAGARVALAHDGDKTARAVLVAHASRDYGREIALLSSVLQNASLSNQRVDVLKFRARSYQEAVYMRSVE